MKYEGPRLNGLYFHYFFLKFFVWQPRLALHLSFVCINCVDGIVQDPGNLFDIADAHPDQCEYPKFGIQELVVFKNNTVIFFEIGIKNGDEVGKEFKEDFVEADE